MTREVPTDSAAAAPASTASMLRRSLQLAVGGHALLLLAGLRHQLFWGISEQWPWLPTLLHWGEFACLVAYLFAMGAAWLLVMRAAGGSPDRRRLRRATFCVLLAAVLVPLLTTTDPVDYVIRGRILTVHGGNPYTQVAADFPDDPFVAFGDAGWKRMPLPYGPLVADVQGVVAGLVELMGLPPREGLVVGLLLFKLLFAVALLWTAMLLRPVAEKLAPGRGEVAFVAITWNPLLLFEGVVNAHNEPLLMVCLAAFVAAWVTSLFAVATVALGLGVLTKIVPVVLLPPFVSHAFARRRLSTVATGVALLVPVLLLWWWRFFAVDGAFDVFRRQAGLQGGSFWWALSQVVAVDLDVLVRVGRLGVVAWVAWCCLQLLRRREPRELLFAVASSLCLLALFGAALFGPWYHLWWVPFALLLGRGYLYRAATFASLIAPLGYAVWLVARRMDEPMQWCIVTFAVAVPMLAAALWRRPGA